MSPCAKLAITAVLSRAGFAIEGLHCAAEFQTQLLLSAWRSSGIICCLCVHSMAGRADMDTMQCESSAVMFLFGHQQPLQASLVVTHTPMGV